MATRILFVDDEENILRAVSRVTIAQSYSVVTVSSPKKALVMIEQAVAEGMPYAVVVSDYQMPEMSGSSFLEKVRYMSPDTVRMLLTGYTDAKAAIDCINRGAVYR